MFLNWGPRTKILIFSSVFVVSAALIVRLFLQWRRRYQHAIEFTGQGERIQTQTRARQLLPMPQIFNPSSYHIEVVESAEACELFLSTRIPQPLRIVGLDCEWRSREREASTPVALLQLAFPNHQCLLVRLCELRQVTPTLENILSNRSILKFGVGISTDAKRLASGFGVQTVGCVDLQHIAVRCGIRSHTSLQGLSLQVLGMDLDKRLRFSDWEAEGLSQDEINYAASDAIVALHILKGLVQMKLSKADRREFAAVDSATARNWLQPVDISDPGTTNQGAQIQSHDQRSDSDWVADEENNSCLVSLCQGIVDAEYKPPRRSSGIPSNRGAGTEARRTSAYSVRQTPLYHNCKLLAPDGALLATVDRRKLEWYLERGLGTVVLKSPPTLRLHFEPSGRPTEDRQYYLAEKENICVVCGKRENCIRKNIVPHEYRKYFPPQMKDHLSHDVLLLCVSCHQLASQYDAELKQQLAHEYSSPINASAQKYQDDPLLVRVRNHARALLRNPGNIPESRKRELFSTVADYFDCSIGDVNEDLIKQASEVNPKSRNTGYTSHAEVVISKVKAEGRVFEFQKKWRKHFLDKMHPKFLPALWCVDHNPQS